MNFSCSTKQSLHSRFSLRRHSSRRPPAPTPSTTATSSSTTASRRDAYFFSSGNVSAPSTLQIINGKLPVETKVFKTPPNALRLEWTSVENGGWDARIDVMRFRNRRDPLQRKHICRSGVTRRKESPRKRCQSCASKTPTKNSPRALKLDEFTTEIPASHWTQIKVPLAEFTTASLDHLDPQRMQSLIFSQGEADAVAHTLILDEIRIDDEVAASSGAHRFRLRVRV